MTSTDKLCSFFRPYVCLSDVKVCRSLEHLFKASREDIGVCDDAEGFPSHVTLPRELRRK